mgnify:CR=1 FL=1
MNSSAPSVGDLVRRHLFSSTAGKIAVVGALLQVPMVAFLGIKAYAAFPDSASDTLGGLALMHLGAIAAMFGCWLYYGMFLGFKGNLLQNMLLILVALAPFFPTYAALSTA